MPKEHKKKKSEIVIDTVKGVNEAFEKLDEAIDEHFANTMRQIKELYKEYVTKIKSGELDQPLLLKTPGQRKRRNQRIDAIPEESNAEANATSSSDVDAEKETPTSGRTQRKASLVARKNMIKQQSLSNLTTKMRRNSKEEMPMKDFVKPKARSKRRKAKKSSSSSFEEEENARTLEASSKRRKRMKVEDETVSSDNRETASTSKASSSSGKMATRSSGASKRKLNNETYYTPCNKLFTASQQMDRTQSDVYEPVAKKLHREKTPIVENEASVYEDAVGTKKSLASSTMVNPSAIIDKKTLINVSAVNPVNVPRMNETVTLAIGAKVPVTLDPKKVKIKYSSLISEESDYEQPVTPKKIKRSDDKRKDGASRLSPSSKGTLKKPVEAVDREENCGTLRVSRSNLKATSRTEDHSKILAANYARKSLSKAKKISLMKDLKQSKDEQKENTTANVTKRELLQPGERQRIPPAKATTPLAKIRPRMPSSVSKVTTPKQSTICTSADQFASSKSTVKRKMLGEASAEKCKEREELAALKRRENLKASSEQKKRRREEKEERAKMLRKQQEKEELEKRLKIEREREEKERLARLTLKRESERKRLLQVQKMQEKEEKRKMEEQAKLKRKRAEEKKEKLVMLEAEAERRRLLEQEMQQCLKNKKLNAQIQAQATAAKTKKVRSTAQANNYFLESEPDDETDDELRPKYTIPEWAKPENREPQLQVQKHIPLAAVHKMFSTKRCTPDLMELFQGYDKDKCRRNSSAVWKSPPRYSMMDD